MTTIEAVPHINCTADQAKLLDEIHTAATAVLTLVPMDTDRPHVHLGVRALMARAMNIAEALQEVVEGNCAIAGLARMVPGAALDAATLHLELLMELQVVGDAALAIVQASGIEPINLQFFVACLQSRAGLLHDEWNLSISTVVEAACNHAALLPEPRPQA